MDELKRMMIMDAKAYNKYLTFEYFKKKSVKFIYAFTHPLSREEFKRIYKKLTSNDLEYVHN